MCGECDPRVTLPTPNPILLPPRSMPHHFSPLAIKSPSNRIPGGLCGLAWSPDHPMSYQRLQTNKPTNSNSGAQLGKRVPSPLRFLCHFCERTATILIRRQHANAASRSRYDLLSRICLAFQQRNILSKIHFFPDGNNEMVILRRGEWMAPAGHELNFSKVLGPPFLLLRVGYLFVCLFVCNHW